MTQAERQATNRRTWLQGPPRIGPYQMRDVTGGTLELCRELGVNFVDDFEALGKVSEAEAQRQVFTFLFIHGYHDQAEMLRAVWLDETEFRRQYLIPFAMPLPVATVLASVFEWLLDVNAKTIAALVQVVAKPGEQPKEAPPPN